jgi:hypothetical protein
MLWFVMDENSEPTFLEDPNNGELYQVICVIKSLTLDDVLLSEYLDQDDERHSVNIS